MMAMFLTVMVGISQASWMGKTCSRLFDIFSVSDPNQYEEVLTDALLYHYTQLGIKGAWGTLEDGDAKTMNIIGAELRWRMGPVMKQFETYEDLMRIDVALGVYERYEGKAVQTKDRK
jgi:hypothetical protein